MNTNDQAKRNAAILRRFTQRVLERDQEEASPPPVTCDDEEERS